MEDANKLPTTFTLLAKVELIRRAIGLDLTFYEMRVLIALISLVSQRAGVAYPPRRLIGEITAINVRHVSRALRALCERGLVTVATPGTPRLSTRYKVNIPAILAGSRTSKGLSEVFFKGTSKEPTEIRQPHLEGHCQGAPTGAAEAPPQAPEEQSIASEVQTKLATELQLNTARIPSVSPKARLLERSGARPPKNSESKNSWRLNYRKLEDCK